MTPLTEGIIFLVRVYQRTLSPDHGPFRDHFRLQGKQCRFLPTCSEYFIDAVRAHGVVRGAGMGARRILRCRPGGGAGYDPVTTKR